MAEKNYDEPYRLELRKAKTKVSGFTLHDTRGKKVGRVGYDVVTQTADVYIGRKSVGLRVMPEMEIDGSLGRFLSYFLGYDVVVSQAKR